MTGEITLRAKVLTHWWSEGEAPCRAPRRQPDDHSSRDNEKDLADLPVEYQQELTIRFVDIMDDVLEVALEKKLDPAPSRHGRCYAAHNRYPIERLGPGAHDQLDVLKDQGICRRIWKPSEAGVHHTVG